MTLCDDCVTAESDPLYPLYTPAPCCLARMVANTPRRLMADAYSAAIAGLEVEQAAEIRDRAYGLIKAAKDARK